MQNARAEKLHYWFNVLFCDVLVAIAVAVVVAFVVHDCDVDGNENINFTTSKSLDVVYSPMFLLL